ncbi:uncharacterized protein LOC132196239 [Neocloeon triangulifer]|uniref:uncharacterized protein LOC132196239 n=1 Tax=Neocloeon triangulifer TaxID=2078957 RepID=UPI00286F3C95|nr:uncharacterized protein LOC132196239 [Neocloeon triangulifer]
MPPRRKKEGLRRTLFQTKMMAVTLLLMFHFTCPVSSADRPDDDALVKEAITSLNLKNASCVVFVGETSAGINELKKFLRHDETLTVEKANGKFKLNANEEKTFVPSVSVNLESRSRLFTLTDDEPDLPAQLFNKRIFETAGGLKITIVESFSNLLGDFYFETLTKAIKNVIDVLGDKVEWYGDSLSLVATKVDRPEQNDAELNGEVEYKIKEFVKFAQKQKDEALLNNDWELVADLEGQIAVGDFLLKKKRFGILRTPNAKKSPWDLPPLKKNYNQLRKLIFQTLDFSSRIGSAAEIVVTAATRKAIKNTYVPGAESKMSETLVGFATFLGEALYGKLFNQFDTFSVNFFPAAFDRLSTFAHLEALIKLLEVPSKRGEDVGSVAYRIQFYYEILGKSFEEYEEREILGCKSEFRRIFSEVTNNHKFLASLRRDHDTRQVQQNLIKDQNILTSGLSVENFQTWQKNLANLGFSQDTIQVVTKGNDVMVQEIESLAQSVPANEINNATQGVLLYSGHYVFLSQVSEILSENTTHEVEIVAMRKLFVDCDLNLTDTHLTIWAPVLEVDKRWTKFSLKGSDAPPIPNSAPTGTSGAKGFSSGKFHLVVREIVNSEMLFVESLGGNGSDGVGGRKGADGDLSGDFRSDADFDGDKKVKVKQKSDWITDTMKPEYISSYYEYGCHSTGIFTTYCEYDVIVTKNLNIECKPGQRGGDAGAGALPGEILINERILFTRRNGTNGKPGLGGKGGNILVLKRYYYCDSNAWNNKESCWKDYYTQYYNKGEDGQLGNSLVSPVTNYKHTKQKVFFDAFLRLNLLAIFSPSPFSADEEFLQFASNEDIVKKFTTQNFFQFLGAVQDAFVNSTHTTNLKIVVRSFYESFTIFKQLGKESDSSYLDLIELMFVDTLAKCDSLTTGRQVVKLGDKITSEIRRLNEVKDIKQDLFVYETVKKEGEKAAKEIAEAEKALQTFYDEEMTEIGEEIDSLLEELIANVYQEQNEYGENIAELQRNKRAYQRAMRRKAAGKIFGWSFKIAGAFFPVAGLAGSAMLALGNSGSGGGGDIEHLLPEISNAADNAASVVLEYLKDRERDARTKQQAQLEAIRLFLDDKDLQTQVLSQQEYENAKVVFDEASNLQDVDDEFWNEFYETFEGVEEKILAAKGHAANEDDEVKLSVYGTVFKGAKEGFLFAKDVFGLVSEIKSANAKLEQIDAAIDANRLAIKQLDVYRKMIDAIFIPMLQDMGKRLNNMQTELEEANSVLTGIKAFEMKKKIREFADFATRFTGELLDEDGFASLSAELQDVVNVLAEGYDKIEEISYRLEMKQFIGTISGGDCNQATNIETCNAYLAARAEDEKSHLLVAFIEIFAAYRQVIFPFVADKAKFLARLVEKLRSTGLGSDGAIREVQASLDSIKTELDDMSTSITDQDKDIIYAIFNPKFRTGRAFYTWPAGNEHLAQVEDLFSGKDVSLVASTSERDARNAIKFKVVSLNFTSTDPKVNARVQDLLLSFRLETTHVGPSHYRCGKNNYVIGGDPLHFSVTYERDEFGNPIEINEALSKLKNGDVPLSPFTVWRFKLEHIAFDDEQAVREELLTMAGLLDMELIGEGYYVKENAEICQKGLSNSHAFMQQQY